MLFAAMSYILRSGSSRSASGKAAAEFAERFGRIVELVFD